MTRLSVVIPAHDEESLIRGAIERLGDAGDALDVLVVANGCRDRTAEVAREQGGAWVIEIAEASKVDAINAGLNAVVDYPVAFVDADVTVSGADLVELARRVDADDRVHIASPTMRVIPSRSWLVRQHYRIWELTEYRESGHVGSGIYLLSESGRRRFDVFPEVIADDLFAQRLFRIDERLTAEDLFFSVRAPATLRALLRRNTRIAAGNRQLAALFPQLGEVRSGAGARALVKKVWRRPRLWAGFVVYSTVYVLSHRRARRLIESRAEVAWNRDDTSRTVSS